MRCFSSPGSPRTPMDSAHDDLAAGFPHSEIRGSKPAHGSPRLIAACHVLHRLSTPRHPPDALTCSRSASPTPRARRARETPPHMAPEPGCTARRRPPRPGARPFAIRKHAGRANANGMPNQCLFTMSNTLPPAPVWWSRTGSNRRPPACKAGALPAELRPRGPG